MPQAWEPVAVLLSKMASYCCNELYAAVFYGIAMAILFRDGLGPT